MSAILDAMARALRDLFNLRVLWVVLWPMLVAGLLWIVLAVTFWGTFSSWMAQGLDAIGVQTWLAGLEPLWLANGIQVLLHLLLFVPLVYLTALIITALFGMPALIRVVAERDYPELKRASGGGLIGSLWNAAIAMLHGEDVVDAILRFAAEQGITQIFVGHSQRTGLWQNLRPNPVERLILESGSIDIRVFPQAEPASQEGR